MTLPATTPVVIYVDVDDTLIRTAGTKRIPVSGVADHIRRLADEGAVLYCWSSGGAEYSKTIATELGIAACFTAFLPKPNILIDDQEIASWRRLVQVHPGRCASMCVESYRDAVTARRTRIE
jgi:hypothetical protein